MAMAIVTAAERALFAEDREEERTGAARPAPKPPPTGRPMWPPLARYAEFRDLLRRHREARGWSGKALARAAGIDHGQVSRIGAGIRRPSPETVARLAVALDLTGGERDRFYLAGGALPPDVPVGDLVILLGIARAGDAELVTLGLQLARAARLATEKAEGKG